MRIFIVLAAMIANIISVFGMLNRSGFFAMIYVLTMGVIIVAFLDAHCGERGWAELRKRA